MRRTGWVALAIAVIVIAGIRVVDAGERDGQAWDDQQSRGVGAGRIVGTWTLQITLANCQTGEEISGTTFPGLNTFLTRGSMLSDPAANPARLRTGHGVWAHAGGRRFTNTVVLFRFNPDGTYAGTQTVRRNITLSRNSDEFVALDTSTSADPAGTVVDVRCGIGRGQRLQP